MKRRIQVRKWVRLRAAIALTDLLFFMSIFLIQEILFQLPGPDGVSIYITIAGMLLWLLFGWQMYLKVLWAYDNWLPLRRKPKR